MALLNEDYEDEIIASNEELFNHIKINNSEKVKEYIDKDIYGFMKEHDHLGFNALHRASFRNNNEIISIIITKLSKQLNKEDFLAYLNEQNPKGMSALHYASYNGNISIIELLISYEADMNILSTKGYNLFHLAAINNQVEAMILLKDKYNFSLLQNDYDNNSPLHLATLNQSLFAMLFLVSWECDINAINKDNYTPLHMAILNKNTAIIKKLLQYGANRDIKDKNKRTPIHFAENSCDQDIYNIVRKKTFLKRLCCITEIRKNQYNLCEVIMILLIYIILSCIIAIDLLPVINNAIYSIIFVSLLGMLVILYFFIAITNPGFIQQDKNLSFLALIEKGIQIGRYCPFCCIERNRIYIRHCIVCNRCVDDFNYHCFFICNCIGRKNIALFFIFLFVLNLNSIFNIVLLVLCLLSPNEDLRYSPARIPFMIPGADWLYYNLTKIIVSSITLIFSVIIEIILFLLLINKIKHYYFKR